MMLRKRVQAYFYSDSGTSEITGYSISNIPHDKIIYKTDDETKSALLGSIKNIKLGLEHNFSSKTKSILYENRNNNDDIMNNDESKDNEDYDSLYLIDEKKNKQIKKNNRTSKNNKDENNPHINNNNPHNDNNNGKQHSHSSEMSAKEKNLLFAKVLLLYICLN
jgi:hypothetical protein